jgi:hypothetical protein
MSQKGGKRAYRSRLRKNQSACKSRHSVFSFLRDHVRLRSSPRRNATLSRHKAVRISARCMRWVPSDVPALGRSGQPLEQPASASWSVTKPSQPPAMIATGAWTCPGSKGEFPAHTPTELACLAGIAVSTASDHLLKLGRGRLVSVVAQGLHAATASPHGGHAPAPAITRATAAHRSRAAPGSDLSRSSRRRTRRRHHGRARRGRAFGRRRNGHRSRARAVLRLGLSAEWRSMEAPAVPPALP